MSDADDLVEKAQKQLEEHKKWLADELEKLPIALGFPWMVKYNLVNRALEIRLRVVKASTHTVTAVYDYPDELYQFLRSDVAPKHLRDSLAGGHVVDPNQPTFSVKREVDGV
jgi:hypothetical protein